MSRARTVKYRRSTRLIVGAVWDSFVIQRSETTKDLRPESCGFTKTAGDKHCLPSSQAPQDDKYSSLTL